MLAAVGLELPQLFLLDPAVEHLIQGVQYHSQSSAAMTWLQCDFAGIMLSPERIYSSQYPHTQYLLRKLPHYQLSKTHIKLLSMAERCSYRFGVGEYLSLNREHMVQLALNQSCEFVICYWLSLCGGDWSAWQAQRGSAPNINLAMLLLLFVLSTNGLVLNVTQFLSLIHI